MNNKNWLIEWFSLISIGNEFQISELKYLKEYQKFRPSCAKDVCLHSKVGANRCYLVSEGGKLLKKELDLDEIQERFWADSKQVLGYIIDDVWHFKEFVANKLQQIKYYMRSMMLHSN